MKSSRLTECLFAVALVGLPISSARAARVVVAFHETLAPHGDWVVTRYGEVWRPAVAEVGVDFVPYCSGGHWVYTDVGWVFEAGWAWGWAPFHYGYWVLDPVYGWVWIPGDEWAPAWVEWRYGAGYVGWTPLGPPGVTVVHTGPAWTFVHVHDFVRVDVDIVRVRIVERTRVSYAVAHTRRVPRTHVVGGVHVAGPAVREVSRESGVRIHAAHVERPARGVVKKAEIRHAAHEARRQERREEPRRNAERIEQNAQRGQQNRERVTQNPERRAEPTATPSKPGPRAPREGDTLSPDEKRHPSSQAKRRKTKRRDSER